MTGMGGTMKIFQLLALYMSFDAEFNADSEYVHGFEVFLILKGLLGQKPCFGDIL